MCYIRDELELLSDLKLSLIVSTQYMYMLKDDQSRMYVLHVTATEENKDLELSLHVEL